MQQDTTIDLPSPLGATALAVGVAVTHEVSRRRTVSALERDGLTVTAAASAVARLAARSGDLQTHAVVLGCEAADVAGAVAASRRELPRARVVLVCPSDSRDAIRRALRAGVDGLVLESQVSEALGLTVRSVCAGQLCIPLATRKQVERGALSYREKQILGMVVMGFSNAEIASKLFLAESTVKSHLSSAFGKLGVRSRSEAASAILDPSESLGPGILAISAAELPGNGAPEPAR